MSSFRIEVEKDGVWHPVQVLFDIRTPLPAMYARAREFQDEEHCPVRVVVVHVFTFEHIDVVQTFDVAAGSPTPELAAES